MENEVATLRRFNRHYTQRIGALDDRFLGSDRPLGPARLLFEIGLASAPILDLRHRLGLDSGHLSRLLRGLQAEGLVELVADPDDRRRRIASLTAAGRREWHVLDERSDRLARSLIEPLTSRQRHELDGALRTADRLLRAATVSFERVGALDAAAQWAMEQYFSELDERFDEGFDAAGALAEDAPGFSEPLGEFVVAFSDGEPVACGGLQVLGPATAEIKRMWVDGSWRGLGLGKRMLSTLEERARAQGHHTVRLDTNSVLTEAIAMYESSGYRSIERYNDNPYARCWFEKSLE